MQGFHRTEQVIGSAQNWLENASKEAPHLGSFFLSLGLLPCRSFLVIFWLVRRDSRCETRKTARNNRAFLYFWGLSRYEVFRTVDSTTRGS